MPARGQKFLIVFVLWSCATLAGNLIYRHFTGRLLTYRVPELIFKAVFVGLFIALITTFRPSRPGRT